MIRSRDNPRVKRWSRLLRDRALRRREGCALVEGPHLVAELLQAGIEPLALLVSESGLARREIRSLAAGRDPVVLSDGAFAGVSDTGEPPGIAAEFAIPRRPPAPQAPCAFLEGVQDPSNVGAILRSAAAFGIGEVVLDRACADPWAPKALRAAMGGHFRLALRQVADLAAALDGYQGRLLCTVPAGGVPLRAAPLEARLGWIFGAEGQGVSAALAARAACRVSIPMHPGAESLNVAAAAAICFYEAFLRR